MARYSSPVRDRYCSDSPARYPQDDDVAPYASPAPNDIAFSKLFQRITTPVQTPVQNRAPETNEPHTWPVAERRRLFEKERESAPECPPRMLQLDDVAEVSSLIHRQESVSPTSTRHLMSALRGRNCSFSPGSFGSIDEASQSAVFAMLPSPCRVRRRSLLSVDADERLRPPSPEGYECALFRVPTPEPRNVVHHVDTIIEDAVEDAGSSAVHGEEENEAVEAQQTPVGTSHSSAEMSGHHDDARVFAVSDEGLDDSSPSFSPTFHAIAVQTECDDDVHDAMPVSCGFQGAGNAGHATTFAPMYNVDDLHRRESHLRELEEKLRQDKDEWVKEQRSSLQLREQSLADRERSLTATCHEALAVSAKLLECKNAQQADQCTLSEHFRSEGSPVRPAPLASRRFWISVFAFMFNVLVTFPCLWLLPAQLWARSAHVPEAQTTSAQSVASQVQRDADAYWTTLRESSSEASDPFNNRAQREEQDEALRAQHRSGGVLAQQRPQQHQQADQAQASVSQQCDQAKGNLDDSGENKVSIRFDDHAKMILGSVGAIATYSVTFLLNMS